MVGDLKYWPISSNANIRMLADLCSNCERYRMPNKGTKGVSKDFSLFHL